MQEKTIFKISFICIMIGLLFLFFYSEEVDGKFIQNLDETIAQEEVRMEGIITKLSAQEKVIFLELEGQKTETMNVVVFEDENILLKEGDFVEISGLVEEYKGKKEVIADSVEIK